MFSSKSAVKAVVADYLELGTLKPFSQLVDLSRFASSLVMSEPRPPRIAWDQNVSSVSIDGERITLDCLRMGLTTWLQELNRSILYLTGEGEVQDWLADGHHLVDDPRERKPGYSFLDDPQFHGADRPLLERLVTHDDWKLGILDNDSSWRWNRASLIRFFSAAREIQERLMPLLQIASKTRGTELADTSIRNCTSHTRTLMIYNGRLYNNMAYTKTTELTEHNSFLPCLIPEEISRPLIHYLAIIRPVEILLSGELWFQEQQRSYQTYLFVVNGERLGSADDSDLIYHFFQEHCDGAFIKLNRWRQVSASINREFIDEQAIPRLRRSDSSMGHSTMTARLHYSQDHDTPDFLTSDTIQEQTWIDEQFHTILGLGQLPSLIALRLKKSTQATQIQEIKEELSSVSQQLQKLPDSLVQVFKTAFQDIGQRIVQEVQEQVKAEISAHRALVPSTPLPPITPSRPIIVQPTSSIGRVLVEATPTPTPTRQRPTTTTTTNAHPTRRLMLPIPSRLSLSRTAPPASPTFPSTQILVPPTPTMCSAAPFMPQGSPLRRDSTLTASSPEWSQELSAPPPRQPPRQATPSPSQLRSFYTPDASQDTQSTLSSPSSWTLSHEPSNNMESDIATLGSSQPSPSSPSARNQVPNKEEVVLRVLRHLHGPDAVPKSQGQLDLCVHTLEMKENIMAILPTGCGKSTAWMVAALARPDETMVVIVPFKGLLEQHLQNARDRGCKAMKWTAKDKDIPSPDDKNLLFMACETAASSVFQRSVKWSHFHSQYLSSILF